ncbi:hypothetical protein L6R53_15705 [Myxococcota bacterium]|nr:hypothetical protein [Myxococcota bacterium]
MSTTLLALLLALGTPASAGPWETASQLRADLSPAVLTEAQRDGYRTLVQDLAANATHGVVPRELVDRATSLGLRLVRTGDRVELRPATLDTGAAGVLVMRLGPLPAEVVLAAPHPFDDLRTGTIASTVFQHAPIRALFISTQSRNAGEAADPSHNTDSALQLVTEGLTGSLADPWFVQIHGFGHGTTTAGAVVSGGSAGTPRDLLERGADLVSAAVGGADVRTSRMVPALAARANVQGQWLRDRARFLHLELGVELRRLLEENPRFCEQLGTGLVAMADADPHAGELSLSSRLEQEQP